MSVYLLIPALESDEIARSIVVNGTEEQAKNIADALTLTTGVNWTLADDVSKIPEARPSVSNIPIQIVQPVASLPVPDQERIRQQIMAAPKPSPRPKPEATPKYPRYYEVGVTPEETWRDRILHDEAKRFSTEEKQWARAQVTAMLNNSPDFCAEFGIPKIGGGNYTQD